MSKCRITIQYGSKPYILIAPHGYQGDDYNTALICERTASILDCNSIINHGWKKSDRVDIFNDCANCNNYSHMVDVVKDEFLHPILRTAESCVRRNGICIVIWIHGVSNYIRKIKKNENIDMILGHGNGKLYNSYTCPNSMKEFVIYNLNRNGIKCFESLPGGNYAGWHEHNMNQLWVRHYINPHVYSLQLEIIRDLRDDDTISMLTSDYLAESIKNIEDYKKWVKPNFYQALKI